ncbi:MAG: endonuclease/exonuclease/phosphatase family protein [Candidatus Brocadiales bacterium]
MAEIRIATFNVENLFDRPMVMNLYEHSDGDEKLAIIAKLQRELERTVYNKPLIIDLYKQVKNYIKINVMKSDVGYPIIYKPRNAPYRVRPKGRKDWYGFIQLKRDKFDDITQKNTARVIRGIGADVMCMVEIGNRLVLKHFNSELLSRMYSHNMLIDGNDTRGIDVGLFSKLELGAIKTNIFDGPAKSRTFSRDCLEVEVITKDGQSIYFLVNHLKSKSGWDQRRNDDRRKRQADRIKEILKSNYDLCRDMVVVAGDLNDTPDRQPLRPLLNIKRLNDVLELQFPNPQDRWTYHYKSNEQIDYILVSDPLRDAFQKAGVERRGIDGVDTYTNGQIKPFPSVTNWRNAASDHGAVWADFNL